MKIHELITQLQNFDSDLEVQVLGKFSDWGFDGESSYEFDSSEWFGVGGTEKVVYSGENVIRIYVSRDDL